MKEIVFFIGYILILSLVNVWSYYRGKKEGIKMGIDMGIGIGRSAEREGIGEINISEIKWDKKRRKI